MEKQTQEKMRDKSNERYISLIRIMQTDIPGNKRLLVGLTYIKGISWSISNAVCKLLSLDPNKKIADLDKKEIEKITEFFAKQAKTSFPEFLLNRRRDFETGESTHLIGTDLDIKKEFDIRRLKKIRSYRGLRHATGQPTRGQRTKSHFRTRKKNKTSSGIKKKKEKETK